MPARSHRVLPGTYRDSIALMRLSAELLERPGVVSAAAVMATPANCEALAEAGLALVAPAGLRPDDLLVAVAARSEAEAQAALAWAEAALNRPAPPGGPPDPARGGRAPRSLGEGLQRLPQANLVVVAVPGEYACAEALKAVKAGRHVFLFSSGVSLEDEARLKRLAAARGLLVMGAECGTGLINGAPLGFANEVRRGSIGLAAASGSGLQEVMCLIDRGGGGVSHAIGAGGRDLHEQVGGLTLLAALDLLDADPATEVIVLIAKPQARAAAERVLARAARLSKPCIAALLGYPAESAAGSRVEAVGSLEEAARAALRAVGLPAPPYVAPPPPRVSPPRRWVRGLFSGGTLCSEAARILGAAQEGWPQAHLCLDLGAEAYTRGRPHPMIDPRARAQKMRAAASDPATAVVLFDIVLGHGAGLDPAGPLIEVAQENRGGPLFVARVVGAPADPQNLSLQEERLRAAGVCLAPTNAAAARMALEAIRP